MKLFGTQVACSYGLQMLGERARFLALKSTPSRTSFNCKKINFSKSSLFPIRLSGTRFLIFMDSILSNSPTHEIGTKICSTSFSANKMLFHLAFVIKTLATRFTIQFWFYNMLFQMILVSSFCLSTMKLFFTFAARSN